jgi:hypothetical protein
MISLLLAALLQTAAPAGTAQPVQDPATTEQPTRLEDIEVAGQPLEQVIRGFVKEVAAPNRGRNLARWQDSVCVGVANLRPEAAQYITDRVSTVAEDLGLRPGQPGCTANILVVASAQPSELAAAMVEERPRAFIVGGSGMDQGRTALRAFQTTDKPVRWWAVSVPVDAETGQTAVRIPGECRNACTNVMDAAPVINVDAASRLRTQVVDNLNRVVVIVDVNQATKVSALQLADYIAMVSLAQIDPAADTTAYSSILNVFDYPTDAESLTDWDISYLKGLYASERNQRIAGANRLEVANSIGRAHSEIKAAREDETEN